MNEISDLASFAACCERQQRSEAVLAGSQTNFVLLKLGIASTKFVKDITSEVLEAITRERSKLLASLVTLRVKVVTNGKEWGSCRISQRGS